MFNKVTLGQVEQLAVQLPPQEQLELLNRLSERLSETVSLPVTVSELRYQGIQPTVYENQILRSIRMWKCMLVLVEVQRADARCGMHTRLTA